MTCMTVIGRVTTLLDKHNTEETGCSANGSATLVDLLAASFSQATPGSEKARVLRKQLVHTNVIAST